MFRFYKAMRSRSVLLDALLRRNRQFRSEDSFTKTGTYPDCGIYHHTIVEYTTTRHFVP
jgi:hypothetical protein